MESKEIFELFRLLREIVENQKTQIDLLNNLYRTFSKYDSDYLTEMEKEGFKPLE